MDEYSDEKSKLTDEESRFMTDQLNTLSDNENWVWVTDEAIEEEIIKLSRDPDPALYEVAKLMYDNDSPSEYGFLSYQSWEHLSNENSLPTEKIAEHLEIYFQMTALREIRIEKYEHLTTDRVDAILKSLLPEEPTIPMIAHMDVDLVVDLIEWYEWKDKLLSRLKSG